MHEDLERRVLAYLVDHTAAADTPEGILVWWLSATESASLPELEVALNALVARGWLTVGGDPRAPVYGLEPSRFDEVRAFVLAGEAHG